MIPEEFTPDAFQREICPRMEHVHGRREPKLTRGSGVKKAPNHHRKSSSQQKDPQKGQMGEIEIVPTMRFL